MGLLGSILGGQQKVQFIQNDNTIIEFDASIHENHTRDSVPTEFPIEGGNTISDHVIVKPFALELNGIISDSPISPTKITQIASELTASLLPPVGIVTGALGVALFNTISNSQSPSVAAYAQLLQLQQNAQAFDVLTTLYRYPSMWIKSITVPRDAGLGNVLMFTISLVQLTLVSPQSVNIQIYADPDTAAGLANVGQQNLNPLQAAAQKGFATEQAFSLRAAQSIGVK
jgi:hypothetical protein